MMSTTARRATTTPQRPAGALARRVAVVGISLSAALGTVAGLSSPAAAADAQSQQWYLKGMSAEKIWKVSTGEDVIVAVVDSGVNSSTDSLKGKVVTDGLTGKAAYKPTTDFEGHGTTIAEMIVGSGAGGSIKGIAPGAKILPIRIAGGSLQKDKGEAAKTAIPAEAIRAAADSDARIINMSFGVEGPTSDEKAAIAYAREKGKILFASVGNKATSDNAIGYPAAYPGVTGVAALGKNGEVGKTSEHGEFVDLAAPGVDVPFWCDAKFKSYCNGEGTSFASAYASASAALIWSAHPDWTSNQVLKVLIDTAGRDWPKDRPSNYLGYGVVRPARNLIMNQGEPGPADVDPITGAKNAVPAGGGAAGGEDAPNSDTKPESGADPSSSETGSSQDTEGSSANGSEPEESAAESNSGGNAGLWIGLGGVAAVIVLGGVGYAVSRRGR